jgi:probable phosphoglycerate mutase
MKRLYLVRHGESAGNIGGFRQSPDTPLSPEGLKQAGLVAKRLKKIKIDRFFSSPQMRAKQTAETIENVINKPITFLDFLIEQKHPSVLMGKSKKDPIVEPILNEIRDNFNISNWRYSDEENFEDLKSRAFKFLTYMENLPEEDILIVTHGIFMRMIVASIIFGEKLTPEEYWEIFISLQTNNTGITLLEYSPDKNGILKWFLISWNDHSHLGKEKEIDQNLD